MSWRPTITDVLAEIPSCPGCGGCAYRISGRVGEGERPAGVTCRDCNTDIMGFYQQRMDGFSQRMLTAGLMIVAIALIGAITVAKLNITG